MKILISNLILYTNETSDIKKVDTIKDTMIYDLCLGFKAIGADVTLAASSDYKPVVAEEYPFEIKWLDTKLKKIFPPHTLPYCPDIKSLVKNGNYDFIITSEVFSLSSLMLAIKSGRRLIVWQELAKHNNIFKGLASRVWYGIIARLFFKNVLIVPRSIQAEAFISLFCNNVNKTIIDHGVNLEKFTPNENKEKQFAVSSQLIARKHIDKIIDAFNDFIKKYDSEYKLFIMGEGELRGELEAQVKALGIEKNVIFTGMLRHNELINILGKSQAMLVYTEKDNNMVSIVESIAVGTPVITTSVPYNAAYIKSNELGIVDDCWGCEALSIISQDKKYIEGCIAYRKSLSTESKANEFIKLSALLK